MPVSLSNIRLETPRLIIREYQPSDLVSIHAYASQLLVVRYQSWGPNSYSDTQEFLAQTQISRNEMPRLRYELAIERAEDGHQIGGCELAINEDDSTMAMIGYLINPIFWNQGYATEVSNALIHFGLNQLPIRLIQATCDSRNIASIRVLEKSGFLLERTIPDDFLQRNELRTTHLFTYITSQS